MHQFVLVSTVISFVFLKYGLYLDKKTKIKKEHFLFFKHKVCAAHPPLIARSNGRAPFILAFRLHGTLIIMWETPWRMDRFHASS